MTIETSYIRCAAAEAAKVVLAIVGRMETWANVARASIPAAVRQALEVVSLEYVEGDALEAAEDPGEEEGRVEELRRLAGLRREERLVAEARLAVIVAHGHAAVGAFREERSLLIGAILEGEAALELAPDDFQVKESVAAMKAAVWLSGQLDSSVIWSFQIDREVEGARRAAQAVEDSEYELRSTERKVEGTVESVLKANFDEEWGERREELVEKAIAADATYEQRELLEIYLQMIPGHAARVARLEAIKTSHGLA